MTTAENLERLKRHVEGNKELITNYLECARTQADLTRDYLDSVLDEQTPDGARKSRGRVVIIKANQIPPEEIVRKVEAVKQTEGLSVVHVAFDPETLVVYVICKSKP